MSVTKKDLSKPRQKLLTLMQELKFGLIRNLHLELGQPQFLPYPVITKQWKLDGDQQERSGITPCDFELKKQHHKLFEVFDGIYNGIIDEIHVRNGLPTCIFASCTENQQVDEVACSCHDP